MTLITVFSQLGGVGKTTTATNLAYEIAQHSGRTLLLDLDTTGGATSVLGCQPAPRAFQWFSDDPSFPTITDPQQIICQTQYPHLDLLPGNYRTEQITASLTAARMPSQAAGNQLTRLTTAYPYVVADVTAAAGVLRDICINQATYLVIPIQCAMRDLDALQGLLASLPDHLGIVIVPTAYDKRKAAHRTVLAYLEEHYDGYLLTDENDEPCPAPNLTEIEQAAIHRRLVCAYAPTGRIAKTYRNLAYILTQPKGNA